MLRVEFTQTCFVYESMQYEATMEEGIAGNL